MVLKDWWQNFQEKKLMSSFCELPATSDRYVCMVLHTINAEVVNVALCMLMRILNLSKALHWIHIHEHTEMCGRLQEKLAFRNHVLKHLGCSDWISVMLRCFFLWNYTALFKIHPAPKTTHCPLVTVTFLISTDFQILSLLESLLNFQEIGYNIIHHT